MYHKMNVLYPDNQFCLPGTSGWGRSGMGTLNSQTPQPPISSPKWTSSSRGSRWDGVLLTRQNIRSNWSKSKSMHFLESIVSHIMNLILIVIESESMISGQFRWPLLPKVPFQGNWGLPNMVMFRMAQNWISMVRFRMAYIGAWNSISPIHESRTLPMRLLKWASKYRAVVQLIHSTARPSIPE